MASSAPPRAFWPSSARNGIDTPLAESAIVGVIIGASLNGLLPIAEIQFVDFIHPAAGQIINEAARLYYRSNGAWPCPVVIRAPNPVLFFEHKRAYRLYRQAIPDDDYTIPIGKAEVKRPGRDITLITYGMMVHHSLKAAATVEEEGLSVEVIDLRTLKPLDKETFLESVQKTGERLSSSTRAT